MKRDLDLIRKLILALEEQDSDAPFAQEGVEGYTEEQVGYHAYLIADAGLAVGVDVSTTISVLPQWELLHLTSAGHDFADAARSDTTWNKAKTVVKEKGGSVTIDVMKQVLVSVLKNTLGL